MRIFVAGLRARRWLNLGLFALGVLAVAAAVAGPLFARSTAEYLLDKSGRDAPTAESGLHAEVTPYFAKNNGPSSGGTEVLDDQGRKQMLDTVELLLGEGDTATFWRPPTRYLISDGELRVGAQSYLMSTYWREGMCEHAVVVGRCPSGPDEALADPLMLKRLGTDVGDTITVLFPTAGALDGKVRKDVAQTLTIVGTYTIADADDSYWYDPSRTVGDATLRPPGLGSQVVPTAPSLLVDEPAISVTRATTAGGDRPLDLDEFNIGNAEDAEAALQGWNQLYDIYGPPAVPGIAVNSLSGVIAQVRNESTLLDRVSVSSAVPLIVLALLMLYVLGAAAAEARRPEVALAKLRGHSRPRIALFALSESLAVLVLAVPAGALVGVAANRVMTRLWLGSTPLVITPQAWTALGAVALAAVVATAVAVVGVVREPVNDSLTVATRRRVPSKLTLLLRGGLVAVAVAAVVQIRSRDVTSSSSYLELLTPLFVGLAASVLAVPLVVGLSRLWTRRTATRGGTTPFLASRRLSRRRDAATLVLPFLLATTITVFAFSAWRVADDWRVSRAAADVGAATAYVTDTPPDQLLRITHAVDPDGRYLAAAVPAASRTQDGARVALVDASRFASVAAWDDSWGAGPAQVQEWLTAPTSLDPITFAGTHVTVDLADIQLEGDLNLPLALALRYTAGDTGRETVVQLGDVPLSGTAHLRAGTPGCEEACTVEQIYLSGSSDSVTDAQGSLRIQAIAADGRRPRRLAARRRHRLAAGPPLRHQGPPAHARRRRGRAAGHHAQERHLDHPADHRRRARVAAAGAHRRVGGRGGRHRPGARRLAVGSADADAADRSRRLAAARRHQRRPLRPRQRAAGVRRPGRRRTSHPAAGRARTRPPRSCTTSRTPASCWTPGAARPRSSTSCAPTRSPWPGRVSCSRAWPAWPSRSSGWPRWRWCSCAGGPTRSPHCAWSAYAAGCCAGPSSPSTSRCWAPPCSPARSAPCSPSGCCSRRWTSVRRRRSSRSRTSGRAGVSSASSSAPESWSRCCWRSGSPGARSSRERRTACARPISADAGGLWEGRMVSPGRSPRAR